MTLYATSQSDSELRLSQERAKYAMLSGSEVVVGISIASTSADARIMVLWRSAAAPPPPPNPHATPATFKMILSLYCPKSVPSTRCLVALKWWLEEASPPTTGARIMVLWRSAAAPPHPLRTITPLYDSSCDLPKCDSELKLSQERAKYAMLGGSKVVVGTSIAYCDL